MFDLTTIASTETGIQVNISNTPFYIHFPSIKTILEMDSDLGDIEFPIENKDFSNDNQAIDYVCNGIIQASKSIVNRMIKYMNIILNEHYINQVLSYNTIPQDLKIKYTKLNIILFMYAYNHYLIRDESNMTSSVKRNDFIDYAYKKLNTFII